MKVKDLIKGKEYYYEVGGEKPLKVTYKGSPWKGTYQFEYNVTTKRENDNGFYSSSVRGSLNINESVVENCISEIEDEKPKTPEIQTMSGDWEYFEAPVRTHEQKTVYYCRPGHNEILSPVKSFKDPYSSFIECRGVDLDSMMAVYTYVTSLDDLTKLDAIFKETDSASKEPETTYRKCTPEDAKPGTIVYIRAGMAKREGKQLVKPYGEVVASLRWENSKGIKVEGVDIMLAKENRVNYVTMDEFKSLYVKEEKKNDE